MKLFSSLHDAPHARDQQQKLVLDRITLRDWVSSYPSEPREPFSLYMQLLCTSLKFILQALVVVDIFATNYDITTGCHAAVAITADAWYRFVMGRILIPVMVDIELFIVCSGEQ